MSRRSKRALRSSSGPNLGKTLQELERQDWGDPDNPKDAPTPLISKCLRLRRTPLRDFSVENLRIMIGQSIGLEYLVPLAIPHLEQDPLAEGDFYPGDLLHNVLRAPAEFWRTRPDLRRAMEPIVDRAIGPLDEYDSTDQAILRAIDRFLEGSVAQPHPD